VRFLYQLLESRPSRRQRLLTKIFVLELEQIVCNNRNRNFSANLCSEILAPDSSLKLGEWKRTAALPGKNLTVDYRTIGQPLRSFDELRKSVGDQIVTARPYVCRAISPNDLGSDSIPFPFCLPIFNGAQLVELSLERICEIERIRTRLGRRFISFSHELGVGFRGRTPISSETM
jgi:hypothetical protein